LAGISTDQKMQGTSFVSVLEGETPEDWQDAMYYHYYEFPFWHHVQPHYGLRTQKYTLAHFYYNIDVWELYDLENDPNQMNNIYTHPDYVDVVSELKLKLKNLMIKFEDNKSLSDFRKITDADFGRIVDDIKAEESVHQILSKK
jgi:arylsulfatase A-like enzyme